MISVIKNWKLITGASFLAVVVIYVFILLNQISSQKSEITEISKTLQQAIARESILEIAVENRDSVIGDYKMYVDRLKSESDEYFLKIKKYEDLYKGQVAVNKSLINKLNNMKFSDNESKANQEANKIMREYIWSD